MKLLAMKNGLMLLCAMAGYYALARFEFFGLSQNNMQDDYKLTLMVGVSVVCVAGFFSSLGNWRGLLLCSMVGVYVFFAALSGNTGMSIEQDKVAGNVNSSVIQLKQEIASLNRAAAAAEKHEEIHRNKSIYERRTEAQKELAALSSNGQPLTISERREGVITLLSWFGIKSDARTVEFLLNAVFILVLYWGSSYLARSAILSSSSRKPQGVQEVTKPEAALGQNQDNARTSYSDNEIDRAVNVKIEQESPKKITVQFIQKAIKEYYKSEVGVGNPRAAAIAKEKNQELEGFEVEPKKYSRFGNVIKLFGGKK